MTMNLCWHYELKLWEVRAVVTSIAGDECIRLRAGVSAGYLTFTRKASLNPF